MADSGGSERDSERGAERGAERGRARGGDRGAGGDRSKGRLVTGAAWVMVMLALWLWGRGLTDEAGGGPALGDVSRAGRLAEGTPALPPAHAPLEGTAHPVRIDIGAIGVHARVIGRGVEPGGGIAPPPYSRADRVGWYDQGPTPGEAGASLLVGHVDTERSKAVFYALSTLRPGAHVTVRRADGSTAEFTVERSRVVGRADFDAHRAYGPERAGRAELRLITCGGTFDSARRVYSSNVIVSAYLTGSG